MAKAATGVEEADAPDACLLAAGESPRLLLGERPRLVGRLGGRVDGRDRGRLGGALLRLEGPPARGCPPGKDDLQAAPTGSAWPGPQAVELPQLRTTAWHVLRCLARVRSS